VKELTQRERVARSLENKDIDRMPLGYRAEKEVDDRFAEYLKEHNLGDLNSFLDLDYIRCGVCFAPGMYGYHYLLPTQSGEYVDVYGNKHLDYVETTNDVVTQPVLAHAKTVEDVEKFRLPDVRTVVLLEQSLKRYYDGRATGKFVIGGMWASIFTHARAILGEEKFLFDLYDSPEMVKRLVERLTEYFLEMNGMLFEKGAKDLDALMFGTDFGTQLSMFISPRQFKKFFKPYLGRIVAQAHGYGLKVIFHSCGNVSPILNDLIEIGVDVLDPVQVNAKGMAPEELAPLFKSRIGFHGGISTQTDLPFGKPEEIRETVRKTIDTLGPLKYIPAPDQTLIGNVPPENIVAMVQAVREYKIA